MSGLDIGRLILEVIAAIVEAVDTDDVETMAKVQDILPPGSASRLDLTRRIEREKTRRALEEQGS